MFLKAVKLALAEGSINKELLKISSDNFVQNFLQLDDYSVQHLILQNTATISKELMLRIRERKLLKRALDIPLNKEGIPDAIKRKRMTQLDKKQTEEIELEIADELGINSAYVILHLQNVKIKLYERFWEMIENKEKPIYIKKKDGNPTPLDEESPFSTSPSQINRIYVFCPEEYLEKARPIAKEKLGL